MKTSRRKIVCSSSIAPLALAVVSLVLAARASATLVAVAGVDTPTNDVLPALAPIMDELGTLGPFPVAEAITHAVVLSADPPSSGSPTNAPAVPNKVITIMNITPGISFTNLYYVASAGTVFSNVDGTINGASAFRIDSLGVNKPLLGESGVVDGILSPGESWDFVVDDYVNGGGLPADAFLTPGVVGAGDAPPSSASIVADIVPEPGSLGLLGLGALALAGCRARKGGR